MIPSQVFAKVLASFMIPSQVFAKVLADFAKPHGNR
jgi:hypothetical protein